MYITKYYKVQSKMGKMIKINQRDKKFLRLWGKVTKEGP